MVTFYECISLLLTVVIPLLVTDIVTGHSWHTVHCPSYCTHTITCHSLRKHTVTDYSLQMYTVTGTGVVCIPLPHNLLMHTGTVAVRILLVHTVT